MSIIYTKKITPAAVNKIRASEAFIALITNNFIEEKGRYAECEIAEQLNKPMYAIIKKNVKWEKFKKFPWRKIYFCEELDHVHSDEIIKDLNQDLDMYKAIKRI